MALPILQVPRQETNTVRLREVEESATALLRGLGFTVMDRPTLLQAVTTRLADEAASVDFVSTRNLGTYRGDVRQRYEDTMRVRFLRRLVQVKGGSADDKLESLRVAYDREEAVIAAFCDASWHTELNVRLNRVTRSATPPGGSDFYASDLEFLVERDVSYQP